MSNHKVLIRFFRNFLGQSNMLVVPVPLLKLLGSIEGALFLNQLIYWSDKSQDKEGWFYKSLNEWERETHLTEHYVVKWTAIFKRAGFLTTKVKRLRTSNITYYLVDEEKFYGWLTQELKSNQWFKEKYPALVETLNTPSLSQNIPTMPQKKKDVMQQSPEQNRDELWDSIPGAETASNAGELEKTAAWAKQYKLLDNADPTVRRVSYLVNLYTGFEPTGTIQAWKQQINALWKAAKQNEDNLVKGLELGQLARNRDGLVPTAPRFYIGFVRSAVAVPKKSSTAAPAQKHHQGQQSYIDKDGNLRIRRVK